MQGTGISIKVRRIVLERDSWDGHPCCIYCGSPYKLELAHIVSRGRGGKGVPENLVVLCQDCHRALDNGSNLELRDEIKKLAVERLKGFYPNWNERNYINGKSIRN